MIDSHCHVTYINDIDKEIEEWKRHGVKAVVTSALSVEEIGKSLTLKEKYPNFVYFCIGLHPSDIDKFDDDRVAEYVGIIKNNRKNIVAIGEIGLDYNWLTEENKQERSKEIFCQMIELAQSLKLPVVIHSRNGTGAKSAITEAIDILKKNSAKRVMLHCFSGNESNLRDALELGYFISYATNICWTKKHPYLASKTPLEQMLLETDSPWLDPDSTSEELKKKDRKLNNRPWKLSKSAEAIEKIKGIPKKEILKITADNARRFFSIQTP